MLANRRIDRLTGRDRYEIISIGTINGARNTGAPGGKKYEKKCSPWWASATIVTATITSSAKARVTAIWLV